MRGRERGTDRTDEQTEHTGQDEQIDEKRV